MAKEFGFIVFGRGRRTWSRLPARSALLLRRGLHRRPAPLDTLRVPRIKTVLHFCTNKKPPYWVVSCLWQGQKDTPVSQATSSAAVASQQHPPQTSELKTIHRIVFFTLLTPLGFKSFFFYTFAQTKNHPIGWFHVCGRGRRT